MGFFAKSKDTDLTIHAPFEGTVIPMSEVPDPVFAGGMLGAGVAIRPSTDADEFTVHAPVTGRVSNIFHGGHAFALVTKLGTQVLVHVGLDTVELKGAGFTALVEEGAKVKAGDPIMTVHAKVIREAGKDLVTPIVGTDKSQVSGAEVTAGPATQGAAIATFSLV
ncbi:PTS glucose transporter subunit IIA [Corynebacterium uropygiale]|uniref:PTS glucose transporter subunit IIA n=1 Tax=Corynebacterium uropygiale TaxID=1775911 RepID=A0A9X1QRP2_9CORY|nr:PTS glucose transporter subunit IIA [Corynebacterium uropygiale]MCF4007157.1 PTS glucose transporter subunit IIA [Corynebacterium uropygiale]